MKYIFGSIAAFISTFALSSNTYAQSEFPVLKGPYFGQKTPELTPEIFSPGLLSKKGRYECGMSFSPNLDEMYFTIQKSTGCQLIFIIQN